MKRTGSLGLSDTCPRLESVPLVLASHTSKPLSAKMNPKDSLGELNSHDAASCHTCRRIICHNIKY